MKKLVFISAVIGLVSCNGVKKETSSVSSGKDTTITQKPMIFEISQKRSDKSIFFVSLQYPMIKG
jgi:hypothetical protein